MAGVKFGVNDLFTWCNNQGDRGRQLISEWTGFDADGNRLDIKKTAVQSNKRAVWRCGKGHTWDTKIQKRTLLGSNCPYCAGQKVTSGENDLYTWCIKNNKQYIIDQFVGIDADGNPVDIHKIPRTTHKKVNWKHISDTGDEHSWVAAVSDRISRDSGCPMCNARNKVIPGVNDLETWINKNIDFGSILASQWTGLTTDGSILDTSEVAYGSHTKLHWVCDCGEIWEQSPLSRIYRKNVSCPRCSRELAKEARNATLLSDGKSLAKWCDENGDWGRILKEQFAGYDQYKNNIDIENITYGSQKKVYWMHMGNHGEIHEWVASIHNRVFRHSGCPYCNNKSTSLCEQIIYRSLKQVCKSTLNRRKLKGYEFDIIVPELNLCIEYGSNFYHIGREQKDNDKANLCSSLGVRFIQIISDRKYTDVMWQDNKCLGYFEGNINNLWVALSQICKITGIDQDKIDFKKAIEESILFMRDN